MRYNAIAVLSFGILSVMQANPVFADTLQANLDSYSNIMRTACVSGDGNLESLKLSVDGKGVLQIRGLLKGGSPGGEIKIDVDKQELDGNVQGAIDIVKEELRVISNENIRDCMIKIMPSVIELVKMDQSN